MRLRGHTRAMSSNEGTWFELRPDGEQVDAAESYRGRAEAEQAATAMLIRRPELQFVAIAEHDEQPDARSDGETVGRVASAQPPAPSEAEVDDLHKLPRGDPEC
jgi:hypothetical protein